MKRIRIGCIADDFTGGSDAASFLDKGGLKTLLYNGVPKTPLPENFSDGAVVIALKIRTAEREQALDEAEAALAWLQANKTEQYYFKYCSTFDSTPEGNIGPVTDRILDTLGESGTILCPALPVNGRQVRDGRLYVNGVPLDQSPMKDHPLTPMKDSRIDRLMAPQGAYQPVILPTNRMSPEEIRKARKTLENSSEKFYLIPDYESETDLAKLVDAFGDLRFLTGGSGLLEGLAQKAAENIGKRPEGLLSIAENASNITLLLAGSCSVMTRKQIKVFLNAGGRGIFADPEKLLTGQLTEADLLTYIQKENGPVLIYSSVTPERLKKQTEKERRRIAELLENTMANLAYKSRMAGCTRLICAGGETSGAITKKLGYDSYYIGTSIAPGVPLLIPTASPQVRLILKSGNFGQEDFFERAVKAANAAPQEQSKYR